MLLNYTLGLTLAFIISIAVAVLIFIPFKKRKKGIAGGFVAFFAAMFIATGLITVNSRAYIVTGPGEYKFYMVYGSPEYTMSGGEKIKINVPIQNCLIVNDTKDILVLQKIVYGGFGTKNKKILPQQTLSMKATSVDYFFDDTPPLSVSTKSSGNVVKFWLRNPGKTELKVWQEMEFKKHLEDKTE